MIDLCINGKAIASNDSQPNYPERKKEYAFDKNSDTMWGSMEFPENKGWIGYDFSRPVKINEIILIQLSSGGSISKVLLQGFGNDLWEDIQNFNLITGTNTLNIDNPKPFNKYRLLAKTNTLTTGWAWTVYEIKMLGEPYKYLIKQNSNYYTIKSRFYKDSEYEFIKELEGTEVLMQSDFEAYGIDNLNSLTKIIDTQIVNGIDKGALDKGKLFAFSLNNEIEKIKVQPISKEVNVTDEVIKDKSFLKWYSSWGSAIIDLPENYYSKISCVFHGDGTSGNQTGYNATFYYSDGTTDKVLNKYKKCYKIIFSLTFTSFISFDIYKIFQLRYLIQYNNAIYTFNEESIISSSSQELDENNFINNGFIDATAIGREQWNIAFPDKSNLKLLVWTDDMSKTDVNIETEIIPFRPIDKLKKNSDICNILFKEA
ncbi:hypothetical protein P9J83_16660 [Clostridium sporogenes]|uniref:F5/8 type C domain-containing protein n=1 Tax=Clostridium sporogenes TaxID=1509 RepID=A0AAE4JXI7_CLOSG|nr:hypothetical protein [Clostridium sporogenes]MDS1005107.1 hypothetical protein [Clostridium sporogenes]